MKKSMIMLAMVMAIVLVGCGNTTAEAATTVTPAPKAEPKVEVETSKKAPTPEAPKPTEAAKVTEAPKPTAAAKVTETPKPTEAPKEAEQPQKVEAVSIEATVNGTHNVGDTLSAKDFTVTINMSDGGKVKNPAGWTANPLVLSSESTAITVAYNGLSTKITVKANPAAVQQQPAVPKPEAKPQQPVNDWPASAYEPISLDSANELYDYAEAHGWYENTLTAKNGMEFNTVKSPDKTRQIGIVYFSKTNKFTIAYYNTNKGDTEAKGMDNYTGTLEFFYEYLF